MNTEYMYAVDRSDEYLAHYGIRGMKWGVRKAIERGNSHALDRQYRKAQKKLAKLEKRANNGSKYAKRAAALGAGAAAAGGLAAAGTGGIGNLISRGASTVGGAKSAVGKGMHAVGGAMARTGVPGVKNAGAYMMGAGRRIDRSSGATTNAVRQAGEGLQKWGQQSVISEGTRRQLAEKAADLSAKTNGAVKVTSKQAYDNLGKVNNNQLVRAGAGLAAAGLAAGAGYNAYRAATTKRAAKKAEQFKQAMNETFKDTKYGNGGNVNRKRRHR